MKKKDGIILRKVGDTSVLVPTGMRVIDLNCLVVLNETARCVWDMLDDRHSIEEIAASLADRFEVGRDEARSDALEFINRLDLMGMLDNADPGG